MRMGLVHARAHGLGRGQRQNGAQALAWGKQRIAHGLDQASGIVAWLRQARIEER
jgi:hypothetical protein